MATTADVPVRYLTLAKAARYIGRSEKAMYHLVGEARVPFKKAGGRLIFDTQELDRWVAGLPGVSAEVAAQSQPGKEQP